MQKAVILAAGRGTRMGDLTRQKPKPLIELHGRAMILHILDRMQSAGIEQVCVVTGYLADQLEAIVRSHPLPATFLRQTDINGTARAALLSKTWVGSDPFLLTFGDILAESHHYQGMIAALHDVEAVLAARYVPDPYQGAAVYIDNNGIIERIIEKPPQGTSSTHWNSAGIYAFRPTVFPQLERVEKSPRGEYELTSAIEQIILSGHPIRMFALDGAWMDVGRPEDLPRAESLLNKSD